MEWIGIGWTSWLSRRGPLPGSAHPTDAGGGGGWGAALSLCRLDWCLPVTMETKPVLFQLCSEEGLFNSGPLDQPHRPYSPRDLPGHSPSASDWDGVPLQRELRGGGGVPEARRAARGRGAQSAGWPRGRGRQRHLLEGRRPGAEELRCFAVDSRTLTSALELPLASETREEPRPEKLRGEGGEGKCPPSGSRLQKSLWTCEGSRPG